MAPNALVSIDTDSPTVPVRPTPTTELPARPLPVFHFGLKPLFFFLTLVCLWLGYKYARVWRANELTTRHERVLDEIIATIVRPPAGTWYALPVGSADELRNSMSYPGRAFRRNTILEKGHAAANISQELVLDVSKLTGYASLAKLADLLVQHYATNLGNVGMAQTFSTGGSGNGWGRARQIWSTPNGELRVILDATVESKSQQARVSILFTDSQQLRPW